jgi:hypothetical protein
VCPHNCLGRGQHRPLPMEFLGAEHPRRFTRSAADAGRVCQCVCVIEREREAGSRGMALAQGCAGTVVWLGGSGRWDDKKTRVVWI